MKLRRLGYLQENSDSDDERWVRDLRDRHVKVRRERAAKLKDRANQEAAEVAQPTIDNVTYDPRLAAAWHRRRKFQQSSELAASSASRLPAPRVSTIESNIEEPHVTAACNSFDIVWKRMLTRREWIHTNASDDWLQSEASQLLLAQESTDDSNACPRRQRAASTYHRPSVHASRGLYADSGWRRVSRELGQSPVRTTSSRKASTRQASIESAPVLKSKPTEPEVDTIRYSKQLPANCVGFAAQLQRDVEVELGGPRKLKKCAHLLKLDSPHMTWRMRYWVVRCVGRALDYDVKLVASLLGHLQPLAPVRTILTNSRAEDTSCADENYHTGITGGLRSLLTQLAADSGGYSAADQLEGRLASTPRPAVVIEAPCPPRVIVDDGNVLEVNEQVVTALLYGRLQLTAGPGRLSTACSGLSGLARTLLLSWRPVEQSGATAGPPSASTTKPEGLVSYDAGDWRLESFLRAVRKPIDAAHLPWWRTRVHNALKQEPTPSLTAASLLAGIDPDAWASLNAQVEKLRGSQLRHKRKRDPAHSAAANENPNPTCIAEYLTAKTRLQLSIFAQDTTDWTGCFPERRALVSLLTHDPTSTAAISMAKTRALYEGVMGALERRFVTFARAAASACTDLFLFTGPGTEDAEQTVQTWLAKESKTSMNAKSWPEAVQASQTVSNHVQQVIRRRGGRCKLSEGAISGAALRVCRMTTLSQQGGTAMDPIRRQLAWFGFHGICDVLMNQLTKPLPSSSATLRADEAYHNSVLSAGFTLPSSMPHPFFSATNVARALNLCDTQGGSSRRRFDPQPDMSSHDQWLLCRGPGGLSRIAVHLRSLASIMPQHIAARRAQTGGGPDVSAAATADTRHGTSWLSTLLRTLWRPMSALTSPIRHPSPPTTAQAPRHSKRLIRRAQERKRSSPGRILHSPSGIADIMASAEGQQVRLGQIHRLLQQCISQRGESKHWEALITASTVGVPGAVEACLAALHGSDCHSDISQAVLTAVPSACIAGEDVARLRRLDNCACCGSDRIASAPAAWSTSDRRHRWEEYTKSAAAMQQRACAEKLGSPVLVYMCPTCKKRPLTFAGLILVQRQLAIQEVRLHFQALQRAHMGELCAAWHEAIATEPGAGQAADCAVVAAADMFWRACLEAAENVLECVAYWAFIPIVITWNGVCTVEEQDCLTL